MSEYCTQEMKKNGMSSLIYHFLLSFRTNLFPASVCCFIKETWKIKFWNHKYSFYGIKKSMDKVSFLFIYIVKAFSFLSNLFLYIHQFCVSLDSSILCVYMYKYFSLFFSIDKTMPSRTCTDISSVVCCIMGSLAEWCRENIGWFTYTDPNCQYCTWFIWSYPHIKNHIH